AFELRDDEKLCGCIAVKIRYPDFETTSRQTSIDYTLRDDELILQAIALFHKLWRKGKPIRLLGVKLSELTNHAVQASLFDDAEKKNNLYKAIDEVKNRFGKTKLQKARTVDKKEEQ
ncbi:MAG: DNA polymerase IV, partial [Chitinophagaceae bacterium]|nr:DNA polymerase IV [Chitinophagaceae bacterium]